MPTKVLVAEDNDDYRTVLRMLLSSLGCKVVEASNGLQAIERAETTHPDLIIMDWIMPQVGGLEATKRLKGNPATREIPNCDMHRAWKGSSRTYKPSGLRRGSDSKAHTIRKD